MTHVFMLCMRVCVFVCVAACVPLKMRLEVAHHACVRACARTSMRASLQNLLPTQSLPLPQVLSSNRSSAGVGGYGIFHVGSSLTHRWCSDASAPGTRFQGPSNPGQTLPSNSGSYSEISPLSLCVECMPGCCFEFSPVLLCVECVCVYACYR